ncbi:MAG: glycosyltransferase family 9 protein [Candidatus Kapaibacterium sp.]|jgi:heptosyltransferase-3
MNIAIFRTDRLGDMILTLPMCTVLRAEYPDAHITIIARKENNVLLSRCSDVYNTVIFEEDFEKWDIWTIAGILRNKKITMVYFPRPRFEEICASWIARVPLRIGSAYRWYSIFLNYKVPDHRREATFHELEYNIRLIEYYTHKKYPKQSLISPFVYEEERKNIRSQLSSIAQKEITNFIIIHPGSRGSSVDWSIDNFGLLAQELETLTDYTIVITGTAPEQEKCLIVQSYCNNAINLCGQCSLQEIMALMKETSLVIANSTGVLHLATALHASVIGLYPNDPSLSAHRWGPYSQNSKVIKPLPEKINGGWNDDMSLITVESVVKLVKNMMQ